MKTLGLIGGMSWESTAVYYRMINQATKERLGGLHSAPLLLHSLDFHAVEALQRADDWDAAGRLLAGAARGLARAGAKALLICANTMHRVAPEVQAAVDIPLLHLADAAAAAAVRAGLARVGLLGTRFTMEQAFYRERLEAHGLRVSVPDAAARAEIDRIIFEELCRGRLLDGSRRFYRRVMADLAGQGAEGIVLGCTEIGLLVESGDAPVPLLDTTAIHVAAAVDWALARGPAPA